MAVTDKDLDKIGAYVKANLPKWLGEYKRKLSSVREYDPVLLERIVRVEERLEKNGELMRQGFEQMGVRFNQQNKLVSDMFSQQTEQFNERFSQQTEQFNERFSQQTEQFNERFSQHDIRFTELREDMNSRFNNMFKFMSLGFGIVSALIVIFKFIA